MNRKILLQVTAPAMLIGLLLLSACVASAWYIHHLQTNLAKIRSENVASLRAALELEMNLRQLRYHDLLYLGDPSPARLEKIEKDQQSFAAELNRARSSTRAPEELALIEQIDGGYRAYAGQLARLRDQVQRQGKYTDFQKLVKDHSGPIQGLIEPCQQLLQLNRDKMQETVQNSDRASRLAHLTLLFLGVGGPIGGLICGYGIARGLSRSIYQLSVRVQDITQRLDSEKGTSARSPNAAWERELVPWFGEQDVASVSVAADGDIQNLDKQLQQVVRRVEEVAQRVQRHQREMLRAEQLSAVGQLAASVAHEIRNPLTSIKLLVEAAARTRNRKPLSENDLEVIHGEIVRLEQTVQSFLDFARLPTPRRLTVDLNQVVAQAVDLVRARARQQSVEIAVTGPEKSVPADIDRGQMCTVLVNLFLNALDAMSKGGSLRIRLAVNDDVSLSVSDTGTGIPAEMFHRLFTPFSSSKPKGTGLGLSISRRIVEEHGGAIVGRNLPEGGACFTITLPASPAGHAHVGQESNPDLLPVYPDRNPEPHPSGESHADAVGRR
jgi:signal transduction histidine kinase